jgi:hypothetical protein
MSSGSAGYPVGVAVTPANDNRLDDGPGALIHAPDRSPAPFDGQRGHGISLVLSLSDLYQRRTRACDPVLQDRNGRNGCNLNLASRTLTLT